MAAPPKSGFNREAAARGGRFISINWLDLERQRNARAYYAQEGAAPETRRGPRTAAPPGAALKLNSARGGENQK